MRANLPFEKRGFGLLSGGRIGFFLKLKKLKEAKYRVFMFLSQEAQDETRRGLAGKRGKGPLFPPAKRAEQRTAARQLQRPKSIMARLRRTTSAGPQHSERFCFCIGGSAHERDL